MPGEQEPRKSRKIKRYANRKLYDTTDSRYVTLQQIAEHVRNGEDVRIIDNTTKEDLTNVTLAQIIYEEEKKSADAHRVASVGTLRHLIQQGGEKLMDTLRGGPVGKLIARKEGDSEPPLAPAPSEEVAEPEPAPRRSMFFSPKEALDELQRLADDRIRGLIGHAISRVQALNDDVGRLHDRIEELEGKLVALQERVGAEVEGEDDPPPP
ncbi:MAG: polyhydroxyalkanoate synthesis regulator DNA-binding domain-containing protein [Sandaracinaceae bacterium]|nr:polyhydroxyalkanoate synthesis regulator DNA-binding domain-containing protein [Sandaracinaceae bacterium]